MRIQQGLRFSFPVLLFSFFVSRGVAALRPAGVCGKARTSLYGVLCTCDLLHVQDCHFQYWRILVSLCHVGRHLMNLQRTSRGRLIRVWGHVALSGIDVAELADFVRTSIPGYSRSRVRLNAFDDEIDLVGTEGLASMHVVNIKLQKTFSSSRWPRMIVPTFSPQKRRLPLAERARLGSGEIAQSSLSLHRILPDVTRGVTSAGGHLAQKSEVRAHQMARKLRSGGFTPHKTSALSSHQMLSRAHPVGARDSSE